MPMPGGSLSSSIFDGISTLFKSIKDWRVLLPSLVFGFGLTCYALYQAHRAIKAGLEDKEIDYVEVSFLGVLNLKVKKVSKNPAPTRKQRSTETDGLDVIPQ